MAQDDASFLIYLVEDDPWYGEILTYHLGLNPDYRVERMATGAECLAALGTQPGLIVSDYSLPDMDGMALVKKIRQTYANLPVVIISQQQDMQKAIDILKEEAVYDYIVKDDDAKDRLWKSVMHIRELQQLQDEVEHLRTEIGKKYDYGQLIKGSSDQVQRIFRLMDKACDNNITVSITGETGTGKELVAKCIHYNSDRRKHPFVAVNVTAIPKELIESELFGYEKGAFTGAHTRRIGKFEEASNGTLFLDEIADMDQAMQGKLLRVLQEREVTRLGSNKVTPVNFRLIVATHKNLGEEVKRGDFRSDLHFRLLGLPIELPPLRERKEDILILAKFFADQFCKENRKPAKTFSPEAKQKLNKYHYPGNIRELKSIIELAAVMADSDTIQAEDVTFNTTVSFTDFITEDNTLKGFTAKIIGHYLEQYDNDIPTVAQKLDIGKSTLYRMVKNGEV
ncbi:MAG: sigma-54 dependent transcriptional regulator [Bacteroidota bacterium]